MVGESTLELETIVLCGEGETGLLMGLKVREALEITKIDLKGLV